MPRTANLGNGNLLVTLDNKGLMRDLYYPHVGMEDHTTYKHFHRIGIYDEERQQMSWFDQDNWQAETVYEGDSLVSLTTLKNPELGLIVKLRDGVHMQENIFIRSIDIINKWDQERKLKIYFNQDLHLYGEKLQDTALFAPEIKNPKRNGAMIHYRKKRYFLINGYNENHGVEEFTTGKAHYRNFEGTWKAAETGQLDGHPIEQGSVDSTIGFYHQIPANSSSKQYYWLCAGKDHDGVERLNDIVIKNTPDHLLDTTHSYWTNWSNQKELGCVQLDEDIMHTMKISLLLVRTAVDNRGAIIAANDSDIMAFNKDTYTYMWPRDGALVAHALDNAGHLEVTRRFFHFCSKIITKDGFFLHKYNPDGSVGSSWHALFRQGRTTLPIQEDETALVLFALDYHYQQYQDIEFMRPMYHSFIKPAAEFLESFISEPTGLPLPTFDLWEEHQGIHIFSVAATIAGLKAASNIAKLMGHPESAERYTARANSLIGAMKKHLWNEERQAFYKYVKIDDDGNIIHRDQTIDSSSLGVWFLGALPADDEMVIKNNHTVKETLWVKTDVGGLARYENDWYQRHKERDGIPGNPWILTTLWYAMWTIDLAKKPEEMQEGLDLIRWATSKALPTRVLPEQLDYETGEHLSVSPLTWSHATYVDAVLAYCHKLEDFGICNVPTTQQNDKSD